MLLHSSHPLDIFSPVFPALGPSNSLYFPSSIDRVPLPEARPRYSHCRRRGAPTFVTRLLLSAPELTRGCTQYEVNPSTTLYQPWSRSARLNRRHANTLSSQIRGAATVVPDQGMDMALHRLRRPQEGAQDGLCHSAHAAEPEARPETVDGR